MHKAWQREESPAAKDAIAQILINSRMCAEGHRPICQDTGIVMVFVKVGMDVRWDGATLGLDEMINEGVRRAYLRPRQRAACLDPRRPRRCAPNTRDNTPAVIHWSSCRATRRRSGRGQGRRQREQVEARDAESFRFDRRLGAEAPCRPWVRLVPARACSASASAARPRRPLLAKEALMDPVDIHDLIAARPVEPCRGAAHRTVREGECARHRRAGPRRPEHRARREDQGLPHARGEPAGGDDPELRRHAPRALRARRLRAGAAGAAERSTTGRTSPGRRPMRGA
jgi:hypothetical protein